MPNVRRLYTSHAMTADSSPFDRIREALAEIEARDSSCSEDRSIRNLDALELPELVASIVDHLQPALHPYEAAYYWMLFRRSVIANGQQYVRVSVRGIQDGVIRSTSGQSEGLSYKSVQGALNGLQEKGALLRAGDTDRDGTLYKVCLPEEIDLCRESMKQAASAPPVPIQEAAELDFYNVPENRLRIFERDGYLCHYCKKLLTRFSATLDHIQPVSEGGKHDYENLVTSCLHCNSRRGSRPVMDAISRPPAV